VDSNGEPRVMAGPVAHGFGTILPIGRRADDKTKLVGTSPWANSYAVAAPPEPDLAVFVGRDITGDPRSTPPAGAKVAAAPDPPPTRRRRGPGTPIENVITIRPKHAIGAIAIELRDHHFARVGTLSARADGADEVQVTIPTALAPKTESIVIAIGAF